MGVVMKEYRSHPDKLLEVHSENVRRGARLRTSLRMAEVAALFHDLGKINPNFQRKVNPNFPSEPLDKKARGYSQHAYLSAFAWLCFSLSNSDWIESRNLDAAACLAIATMIAHHHGNLPNLGSRKACDEGTQRFKQSASVGRIFKAGTTSASDPTRALRDFLAVTDENILPFSEFLQRLEEHKPFTIFQDDEIQEELLGLNLESLEGSKPNDALAFFLDTQFGFASLIEADKRDAGYNTLFNKEEFAPEFKNFGARLEAELERIASLKEQGDENKRLNELRTAMREQAVENIRDGLSHGERIFTLQAPTGAGKTLMLLRLALEILRSDERQRTSGEENVRELGIIYALPFLSITEQTEKICRDIMKDDERAILRVDSKAANKRLDDLQRKLDSEPSEENLGRLIYESFSAATFDHPFVITTFVQLFETLISNRNSVLLRLPNFAQTIFLLDEIQALPPRLYTFFLAYLDEFCRRFDSYAVISTATMPYRKLPAIDNKHFAPDKNPRKLFTRYCKPRQEREPRELLDRSFYGHPEFDRYRITPIDEENFQIDNLKHKIQEQPSDVSCLVILNTIRDTRELYAALGGNTGEDNEGECVLINTHFTPRDRRRKIELCRERLEPGNNQRVVLISTQLIEAGVDIDFPVLYRDMCPFPNLVQSAGRCNRNGKRTRGEVFLFTLMRDDGKASYALVYRREPLWFFASNYISAPITEKELFAAQENFFRSVSHNLECGVHYGRNEEIHLIACINQARFEDIGKFKLIDEEVFGEEFRYYVPHRESVESFEELLTLAEESKRFTRDFKEIKRREVLIESLLKAIANDVVTFRLPSGVNPPSYSEEAFKIRCLQDEQDYSRVTGINLSDLGGCII